MAVVEREHERKRTSLLAAYGFLVILFWLVALAPGRPSSSVGVFVFEVAVDIGIFVFLIGRSRVAWWIALIRNAGGTMTCLLGAIATGGAPGWAILVVVQVATLAILPLLWNPRLSGIV